MTRVRRLVTVLVVVLLAVWVAPARAEDPRIAVFLDGSEIPFDVPPRIMNGRTMVPLRAIFERLGATVSWDQETRTATAVKGALTVTLQVGNPTAKVGTNSVPLDQPAEIVDGRTLVPARFVSEAMGATVIWDGPVHTVRITSAGAVSQGPGPIGQPWQPGSGQPGPITPGQPGPVTPGQPGQPGQQPQSAPVATVDGNWPPNPGQPGYVPPGIELSAARAKYPPRAVAAVLDGSVSIPDGFDHLMLQNTPATRLVGLRQGTLPTSSDMDNAALALYHLGVEPKDLGFDPADVASWPKLGNYAVTRYNSVYQSAPPGGTSPSGWFKTGQSADFNLSGLDLGQTGGPLMFNHPGAIASDGTHLILTDNFNNRVLIWNQLPDGNTPPDVVLGQTDFNSNHAGKGPAEMNWPVGVAVGGGRLVVADTWNDRLMVWNTFPTVSGAPADMIIQLSALPTADASRHFLWPWAVWTDGQRLAATATQGNAVLVWNNFPAKADQAPDLVLTAAGQLGTPRTIISDGHSLLVGDHNAYWNGSYAGAGTYVWKTFPTTGEQPPDYLLRDPVGGLSWLGGGFAADGKLVVLGKTLYVWNSLPPNSDTPPDVVITGQQFGNGDGQNLVVTGNRVYVSGGYSNKVVGYRSIPTSDDQLPDFAIGSPDIRTNTLTADFFIHNPNPAISDGKLLVFSDFDSTLSIWRNLPSEGGARPDLIIKVGGADFAVHGDSMAVTNAGSLMIWNHLPLDMEDAGPSAMISGPGGRPFRHLSGVAIDDSYLYVADGDAGKLYVYRGVPSAQVDPVLSVGVPNGNYRLASDGTYLAVTRADINGWVKVYRVADLAGGGQAQPQPQATTIATSSFPISALPADGHLFVVDNWVNRVVAWKSIGDALAGKEPDAILGGTDYPRTAGAGGNWSPVAPALAPDKLFLPRGIAFDGSHLWVGEFKFSTRLLRFSMEP